MDNYYTHHLTSRQVGQLYRTVQLDYLLATIPPSKDLFRSTNLNTYRQFTIIGFFEGVSIKPCDNQKFFCISIKSPYCSHEKIYKIYIQLSFYREYFIKFFNIITKSQAVDQVLITQLDLMILNDELVFVISERTTLFAVPNVFVNRQYLPILKSFDNRYSLIKLQDIFSTTEVDVYRDHGVPFEDLKRQLTIKSDAPNAMTLTGAVEIKYTSIQSLGRKSCKVMMLNLYQTQIRRGARELGVFPVKALFYFEQEQELKTKLANWSIVVIKNVQRQMDNSGKIEYYFHSETDITVIDNNQWRYARDLARIWKNLAMTQLQTIRPSSILRNFIKLKVELTRMTFIKLFYECKKCRTNCKTKLCEQCNVETEFLLWSEFEVEDSTDTAQLSIQGANLIKFLNITQQDKQQLEDLCIRFNRSLIINKSFESKEKIVQKLFYLMNVKRIEKEIIGIPMIDLKKQVGYGEKNQEGFGGGVGGNFRSININGIIDGRSGKNKWVTKIKVHEVL